MNSYDVIVVGNGVLGLSVAIALRLRSSGKVALVGDETRAFAATPAAGAMLGCFGEVTTSLLATRYGRSKLALAVKARDLWSDWLIQLDELAGDDRTVVTADDTVVVLNSVGSAEVDDGNFRAIETATTMYAATAEPISVDKIAWLDPDPNARPLRAHYLSGERAVDASGLLRRLEKAAIGAGVSMHHGVAARVDTDGARVGGVTLVDGTALLADQVVLAVGARTTELLADVPQLHARIPLVFGGCGVSVLLAMDEPASPPYVLRTPNRAFACGLHLVPRSASTAYLGATNTITLSPRNEPVIAEMLLLLNSAAHQLHTSLYGVRIGRVQVGNRPVAIDGFPLIGETGSIPGLWLLTGTYRDGLHLSPLLAQHLAREMTGEAGMADLSAFLPEREPIQAFSRDEVIADVVRHTLATGFEQPWTVSPRWPRFIAPMMTTHYRGLANELSEIYTPPAEVLSALNIHDSGSGGQQRLKSYYAEAARLWRTG